MANSQVLDPATLLAGLFETEPKKEEKAKEEPQQVKIDPQVMLSDLFETPDKPQDSPEEVKASEDEAEEKKGVTTDIVLPHIVFTPLAKESGELFGYVGEEGNSYQFADDQAEEEEESYDEDLEDESNIYESTTEE